MKWKILYRKCPAWLVGERQEDRDERVRLPAAAPAAPDETLYPGDYAGFVISVVPADMEYSPGDLADPARAVVELDLTPDELAALRAHRSRILDGRLEPVTFEHRFGAIAESLRAAFADPEDLESHEDERIREVSAENMRREQAYMDALAVWAESLEPQVEGGEIVEPKPLPKPVPLVLLEVPEPIFAEKVGALSRALPRTVVHTGAGLYEVGPGKTYSTIQSALDQLWTDQGAAAFTASQYVRVFAGTYDETPTPNASLDPDELNGYPLIIEGDPTDSRENIIVAPTTGSPAYSVYVNCDEVILRHLRLAGTPSTGGFSTSSGNGFAWVDDCDIEVPATGVAIVYQGRVTDCRVEVTVDSKTCVSVGSWGRPGGYVARCTLIGGGKTNSYGVSIVRDVTVEACTICNVGIGVYSGYSTYTCSLDAIRNCTFYDSNYDVMLRSGWNQRLHVIDCVFKDVAYPYSHNTCWPEETSAKAGPTIVTRNNCFHGYTAFAFGPGSTTKTFAEWTALNHVDASGDKDATDPLLTDPASGDFSLGAASPCRHAGVGSGVSYDADGDAFDPYHPDIGAVGTGTIEAPGEPSAAITGVAGSTVTLSVSGDAGAVHHAELVNARTGAVEDDDSREGDGTLSLVASDVAARYFVVVWSDNAAGRSEPAAPLEVFLPGGESPFDEIRIGLVARLRAHAGLREILGTDELGGVPIYTMRPGIPRRLPSVVYALEGTPDSVLDRAGRWHMKLVAEAWGGSPGLNDAIVGAMDEVLSREPFDCTSWSVKRIARTGDGTDWTDDGRTEFRRTEWALVVDRLGD